VIGLFKTEVIRRRGPWRGPEDVEFATLEWVWWFNYHRLLEPIGYGGSYRCGIDWRQPFHQNREPAPCGCGMLGNVAVLVAIGARGSLPFAHNALSIPQPLPLAFWQRAAPLFDSLDVFAQRQRPGAG
jgi:hypothetical protein